MLSQIELITGYFFINCRFSFSWWAYTFPMTGAAIASIQYCHVATSWTTRCLAILLSFIASATVFTLFCTTLLHAFVWKSLFLNDKAIAITARGNKTRPSHGDKDSNHVFTLKHEPLHKVMIGAFQNLISKDHSNIDAVPNSDSSLKGPQQNTEMVKSDV